MRLPYVVEVQERREQVPDANGAVPFSWATVARVHADIEAVKASERVAATAVQGTVTHRVTMRNGGRLVKSRDRLVGTDGIVYEVDGVVADRRKPGKQVATCVEVAGG